MSKRPAPKYVAPQPKQPVNQVALNQPLGDIVADAIAVCANVYVRIADAGEGYAVVLDSTPPIELITLATAAEATAWARSRELWLVD